MTGKFKSNLVSIVIISAVPVLALWQVSFFAYTMKWDILDQFLPCRFFISECLQQKVFPLWCPYINFGYPFPADPQSGLFYPGTWLVSLIGGYTVYSIALEYVFHLIIAATGFCFLLRNFEIEKNVAVVFGLVYCLSGFFISNAQHLSWVIAMAWMPLILLQFSNILYKPNTVIAVKLALFLYLGLTGGYPGLFIILFYFFVVCVVVRFASLLFQKQTDALKYISGYLTLAVVLFLLLSSGYLYSFIEALPHIARGKPVTLIEANNVAFTPAAMVSFLFPFATSCTSYQLHTDVSMANNYMGFLFLPLFLLAVLKTRLLPFQKALLVFAVVCLLAAMGKYSFMRTVFYNFLPGMNMIRHAGIFRVFAVLGFIVVAANGFQWLVRNIQNSALQDVRKVLLPYALLLLAATVFFFYKSDWQLKTMLPFSATDILSFNKAESVYSHLLFQCLLQILLMAVVVFVLFLKTISPALKITCVCAVVVFDMVTAAQLNLPATVISETKPFELQAKLNTFPKGFPVPELYSTGSVSHMSDGSTVPIWYNMSFFNKTPSHDGFNSFYLQSADDFRESAEAGNVLAKPIVFFRDTDIKYSVQKFYPGEVEVQYQSINPTEVVLQQNNYKGWEVAIDNKPASLLTAFNSFLSCETPEGKHTVSFTYKRPLIKFLFWLTVGSFLLAVAFLLYSRRLVQK